MIPLAMAVLGEEVVIRKSALQGDLKRHTDSLGLIQGQPVTPISKTDGGLIIKIKESRFAVNVGIASKIYV